MATDRKYLRFHHGNWWLHYRIPERYKLLPECVGFNAILPKNLETDSLREARRRRDVFLHGLEAQSDDLYKAWLPKGNQETYPDNAPLSEHPQLPKINEILARGSSILGQEPKANKLKQVANWERDAVFALLNNQRTTGRSLKELLNVVVKEAEAKGLSDATIKKIRRGPSWFLENIIQSDIDIADIDHDQVSDFLVNEQERGAAGSTLRGHLYGLSKVWQRAKKSKIVSGDNPFMEHSVNMETESFSPFTYDEIYELYRHAEGELKTLIHAGATTGARVDELLTGEIKTVSTYEKPCWLLKFKDKGKTEQSTRAVPVHDSLKLDNGFRFTITYNTVQKQLKEIQEKVLGECLNELTGKPRKLSFHSLRSTVITELVAKQRINEKVVGGVTGHLGGDTSKVGSIRGYIYADDLQDKKAIVDLLPWAV